jgi:SET domain-containing protein
MYLYKVIAKESDIEGKGVFVTEPISKDSIVWKFDSSHDISLSEDKFAELNEEGKKELEKVGYLSSVSHKWIYPPENDPARFTNHSSTNNNLSVMFDTTISPEPFFKANRDIAQGEELTVNYLEFDEYIKQARPEWVG